MKRILLTVLVLSVAGVQAHACERTSSRHHVSRHDAAEWPSPQSGGCERDCQFLLRFDRHVARTQSDPGVQGLHERSRLSLDVDQRRGRRADNARSKFAALLSLPVYGRCLPQYGLGYDL